MIKYDIGYNIGDIVKVKIKSLNGSIFGIITQITTEFRTGIVIQVLVLDTFEVSKKHLHMSYNFTFGDISINKVNDKILEEHLKIRYKLYLLKES